MNDGNSSWVIVGECSFTALVVSACTAIGLRPTRVVIARPSHDVDPIAGLQPPSASGWFAQHCFYHHSWRRSLDSICRQYDIPLLLAEDLSAVCGTEKILIVAGLARRLASPILRRFGHAAYNVHPSLLPAFGGPQPEAQVILHERAMTGLTIHRITEDMDSGPIHFQELIRVARGTTVGALERTEATSAAGGLSALLRSTYRRGRLPATADASYFQWYDEGRVLDMRRQRSVAQSLRALRLRPEGLAYWDTDDSRNYPIIANRQHSRTAQVLEYPDGQLFVHQWVRRASDGRLLLLSGREGLTPPASTRPHRVTSSPLTSSRTALRSSTSGLPFAGWSPPRLALIIPRDAIAYGITQVPLALGILAALTPRNWEVRVFKGTDLKLIVDWRPTLAAMSCLTVNAPVTYLLCDALRKAEIPVVLGGIHASSCPAEALNHADAVVLGEAEHVWPTVLGDVMTGRLRKRYRSHTPVDLEHVPLPNLEVMEAGRGFVTMMSARGCPHSCSFCSVNKYLGSSVRYVPRTRLKEWVARLPVSQVHFADETTLSNPRRAEEIADVFSQTGKTWSATATTPLCGRLGFLADMASAGCIELYIGWEGGGRGRLTQVNKSWAAVDDPLSVFQEARRVGIAIVAGVIVGFDEDTPENLQLLSRMLVEEGPDHLDLSILTPLPRTRLRASLARQRRLLPHHLQWELHDLSHCLYRPARMSPIELEALYWSMLSDFYAPAACERRASRQLLGRRATYLDECQFIRDGLHDSYSLFNRPVAGFSDSWPI